MKEDVKKIVEEMYEKRKNYKVDYEYENFIIDAYSTASDENNIDLQKEIAKFVIGLGDYYYYKLGFSKKLRKLALVSLSEIIGKEINRYLDIENKTEEEKKEFNNLYLEFFDVLWAYKWIASTLPQSLDISKEEIEDFFNYVRYDYEWLNCSFAPVYGSMMESYILMGDFEKAEKYYELWQNTENDGMEDCKACTQDTKVMYHYFMKDYKKVLELAKPILDREIKCENVPAVTYKYVLKSYIALGKYKEAEKLYPTALRDIKKVNYDLYLVDLIEILMRLDKVDEAIKIGKSVEKEVLKKTDGYYYLKFMIAIAPLNDANVEKAREIAKLYDERNGNNYYENYLNEYLNSVLKYS